MNASFWHFIWTRLNVPELPSIDGVDVTQGPIGVLEGIIVYFIYILASLFIAWVVLSVGRRVIVDFNEAKRETGDFGRVILTAVVGVAVTLFVIFLSNYLVDLVR